MYKNEKDNRIAQLFTTFFKIGAFTFGGGYAMIPLIQKEIIENRKWITDEDMSDIVAIAETTPGPIAINVATFVGYKTKGLKGAIASTVGVVLPSFVIIMLIALAFQKYMHYEVVANAFWGIRIAVIALMIKAFISMLKQCPRNAVSYGVAVLALCLVGILNLNALFVIFGAAIVGMIYHLRKVGKQK
ncbi:MAG: chromate transporter [Eubacteriales bacterium]|nr:chromate transporter [Eubacteriales bacterium]